MKINISKTIILIISFIFILSGTVYGSEQLSPEQLPNISIGNITVEYEYNEQTNEVTAYMISDIELKDTKPTWKLSEDRKTYAKVFNSNINYNTPVENINGVIIDVNINVTQIQNIPAEITVSYEYKEKTNTVIATMISNKELQHTKISWKLSEDKKRYTFEFNNNTNYTTTVVDIDGNVIPVEIKVTQVKIATIRTEYEYDMQNAQIIAKIISDIPLKHTKPTWKLSDNKKTYTKIFNNSTNYTTPVEDISGNIIDVQINIKVKVATITTQYIYDEQNKQVIAKMISDIPLKATKPTWQLSEDRLTYTKRFSENIKYSTPAEDIFGNIIDVNLNIDLIDKTSPIITVEYQYNMDDTVTVYMKSNEPLGKTKPNWILSEDQMTYHHRFSTKQNYTTLVQDIHGNQTTVKIEFRTKKFIYNQNDGSTITVRYLYIESNTAIVDIISSVQMQDTKPTWQLSTDKYKYTKIFKEDNTYSTPIQDINGVTKDVKIMVNISQTILSGIDVSKHNGKIDWEKVKNSGVDFAIIRVGYGQNMESQDDPMFKYNISECERLGIPYGVYIYSYALNTEHAKSEADHVLRLIKGHNPEFGIWYDLEDADGYKQNNGMPSNEKLVDIAITFCEKIKANGYQNVGIYASLDWLKTKLNSSKLDKYDKWVAQWGDKCTYEKDYIMWQYTDSGKVDGITGNVDMNIYYKVIRKTN